MAFAGNVALLSMPTIPTHMLFGGMNEISTELTRFTTLEESFPRVLELCGSILPFRAVAILETSNRATHLTVWHTPDIGGKTLTALRERAFSVFTYLCHTTGERESATADELPYTCRMILKPELEVPAVPKSEVASNTLSLPLVSCNSTFGILHYDPLFPLDEAALSFVNSLTNQLAAALDRTRAVRELIEVEVHKRVMQEAHGAKNRFLANMSHEMRTPLTAILGGAALLANTEIPEHQRWKYSQMIQRNGELLSQLMSDILDLAKVEGGTLDIRTQSFSLPHLLEEVRAHAHSLAAKKGLTFSIEVRPETPLLLLSDRTRLKQILINMIGNAIKFTERGCVTLRVGAEEVHPAQESRQAVCLVFLISDTGPGISASDAARLFQPFEQADGSTTRRHGGAGIGLTLSRMLARALGGDLQLTESAPGEGCAFLITIKCEVENNAKKTTADLRDLKTQESCGPSSPTSCRTKARRSKLLATPAAHQPVHFASQARKSPAGFSRNEFSHEH